MKKQTILVSALLLIAIIATAVVAIRPIVFAQATPSSTATSTPNASTTTVIALAIGDHGVAVNVLQKLLIKDGYLAPITPTSYFGTLTQAAVVAYQKARGFSQTGVFTIAAADLGKFFATTSGSFTQVGIGTRGSQATSLQNFLIKGGYLNIPSATGYFGTLTQAALKAFQTAHGLPQTGVVDQATFAAMNSQ